MATYLVTGGCGFIGSHLCDALIAHGHVVRILDDLSTGQPRNVNLHARLAVADVADPEAVRQCAAGVDGIFHLAAVASVARANEDWLGTHRTNLTGTITVLDTARSLNPRHPVPVVYASSAAVYGDNDDLPLAETAAPRPLSAYGADKLGCELHACVAGNVHGVPTAGLRFFNVFGPRQDPSSPYSGVISIFCERLRHGRRLPILGDGLQQRDFVYVADVVRALIAALEGASTDAPVYNVCTGAATSIRGLAETLAGIVGRPARLEFKPPRAGDIRRSIGNPAAIHRALGWEPRTTLRDGLAETLLADSTLVPAFAN